MLEILDYYYLLHFICANVNRSILHNTAGECLILDPKLTYNAHIQNIATHAQKPLQVIKALTGTTWGKQKETLVATYKAVMRPTLEYASSIWSPMASPTSINKLQVMQNAALRACTGCTHDMNIQHLHDETNILPIQKHLQLHAQAKITSKMVKYKPTTVTIDIKSAKKISLQNWLISCHLATGWLISCHLVHVGY